MKMIFDLLSDSVISAVGWTLVHSLWQGSIIALGASVLLYLFRKKSAALRYNTGTLALGLQVVSSFVTFSFYYAKMTAASAWHAAHMSAPVVVTLHATGVRYPLSFAEKTSFWLNSHLHELVICWVLGAGFLMLRFVSGWLLTERLRAKSRLVTDKEWRARFGVLTARLNIYVSVEFRESARILSPIVIGAFQPVVLIPIGLLTGLPVSQIEAILSHELAHIRRNDYLVNMIQSFAEVIFFFHPAIWWLSERIRTEREHCCDDIAISVSGDRLSLAHALVKVAEWQNSPSLAMAFASKKPLLLQRIRRVLGASHAAKRTSPWGLPMVLVLIGFLVTISLYAVAKKEVEKPKLAHNKRVLLPLKDQPLQSPVKSRNSSWAVTDTLPKAKQPEIKVSINKIISMDSTGLFSTKSFFNSDSLVNTLKQINWDDIQTKVNSMQTTDFFAGQSVADRGVWDRKKQELELEMDQYRFDMERYQRERERIEWKKEKELNAREQLMEKRSELLHANDNDGQKKVSENEIENQLADIEKKIKTHEQVVTQLNEGITENLKASLVAEEPLMKLEREMEVLVRRNMAASGNFTALSLGTWAKTTAPAKVLKAPKNPKVLKAKIPKAPALPPLPGKPAKAPVPPVKQ